MVDELTLYNYTHFTVKKKLSVHFFHTQNKLSNYAIKHILSK